LRVTILPLLQRLNCILMQVKEADGTKQETDANMEIMFGKLRSAKSIALDALVLNRSSFSQTVENLFSLSFLVKDGRAAVNYASDGTHLIVPRNAPTAVDRERGVTNAQFVFRFDFESWKVCLFPKLPSDYVNPMFQLSPQTDPGKSC
jgi:hypothetical protein